MEATDLLLVNAICAKLCHDISSPLGTLIGTLELAMEDPSAAEEALPLALEAAAGLGARLRLVRAAWAGDCGMMTADEIQDLAVGLPPRVGVALDGLGRDRFPPAEARLLLNLLLLGAEALPRGGVTALSRPGPGEFLLQVEGPGASWPKGLASAVSGSVALAFDTPRNIQAPFTVLVAAEAGRRMRLMMPAGPQVIGAPPLLVAPA